MKIGIDLGGSHIGIGLVDDNKIILTKDRIFSNEEKQDIEKNIIKYIELLIAEILEEKSISISNIELIGIACPGSIRGNVILKAENLGLENFAIVEKLIEIFNIPVIIKNDAKSAAIAEKKYGAMKGYDDCIFLTIGTGIGGAAFLGGKLLKPKKSSGLEFRTYGNRKQWKTMLMWKKRML